MGEVPGEPVSWKRDIKKIGSARSGKESRKSCWKKKHWQIARSVYVTDRGGRRTALLRKS